GAKRSMLALLKALELGSGLWFKAAGDLILVAGGLGQFHTMLPVIEALRVQDLPRSLDEIHAHHAMAYAVPVYILSVIGLHEPAQLFLRRLERVEVELRQREPAAVGWMHVALYHRSYVALRDPGQGLVHGRAALRYLAESGEARGLCFA